MDFFSLLKNKPKVYETIEPPRIETEIKLSKSKNVIAKLVDECHIDDKVNVINSRSITSEIKENITLFNLEIIQFKKGETIKVVRLENSILNIYKGYIGTIRDSQKDSNTCMVILDGLNSVTAIKFPKTHLIKWCPYTNTEL